VSQEFFSIEDQYGDTLEAHSMDGGIEVLAITDDHEVVVELSADEVDELIAWLATWKERQSA
jgi:hypothetical protein